MKKLYIDMDNTINDFSEYFILWVKERGYAYDDTYKSQYNIQDGILTDNPAKVKEEIFTHPNFWLGIPKKDNIKEATTLLSYYFDVNILTLPWNPKVIYKDVKQQWVSQYLPNFKNKIIFTPDIEKWKVIEPDSIILDDNAVILSKCKELNIDTIIYDQPYNKDIPGSLRISDWSLDSMNNIIERFSKGD